MEVVSGRGFCNFMFFPGLQHRYKTKVLEDRKEVPPFM